MKFVIELIDTLWNVNKIAVIGKPNAGKELIDTLWNVNSMPTGLSICSDCELIDTLWNVNKVEMQNTRRAFLRINRYIMECK